MFVMLEFNSNNCIALSTRRPKHLLILSWWPMARWKILARWFCSVNRSKLKLRKKNCLQNFCEMIRTLFQILQIGKREHFVLGQYFRKRYAKLLTNNECIGNNIHVQSTVWKIEIKVINGIGANINVFLGKRSEYSKCFGKFGRTILKWG